MDLKNNTKGENKILVQLGISKYLSEFVYGGIDGSITTFAVVAGSAGASFDIRVVLILGFANLIADGFSMSVGNYLSAKAQLDTYQKYRDKEEYEVKNFPEEGREEIREIYRAKGFEGEMLDKAVVIITSDEKRWVNEMMREELEMIQEKKEPFYSALATFMAFVSFGMIPLLAYIFYFFSERNFENAFLISSVLTALAFVVIGYLKSIANNISQIKGIIETVVWGGVAAALAYTAGSVLQQFLLK